MTRKKTRTPQVDPKYAYLDSGWAHRVKDFESLEEIGLTLEQVNNLVESQFPRSRDRSASRISLRNLFLRTLGFTLCEPKFSPYLSYVSGGGLPTVWVLLNQRFNELMKQSHSEHVRRATKHWMPTQAEREEKAAQEASLQAMKDRQEALRNRLKALGVETRGSSYASILNFSLHLDKAERVIEALEASQ